jgi:uncharacterized cysteine cluster protein YcgN (CxxCxxCC family)
MNSPSFWRRKKLDEMTPEEWEQLCDGCGQCCLYKLEDEDSREVFFTCVACRYLDLRVCRCKSYGDRTRLVPTCVTLTPDLVKQLKWLPETCAYRLISEGKDLPPWHWLVSGDALAVHQAGVSVRDLAIPEESAHMDDLDGYVF